VDERSLPELGRLVDRHDVELREVRRDYITRELFLATIGGIVERVLRLEKDKDSRRNALLAVAGTSAGVVLSVVLTYLITRGSGQ
jgi:hypothetical protein